MVSPLTFPLLFSVFFGAALSLGINYGQMANNLPHPESVVPLVKSMGVSRLKLYDADPRVLKAFANTGVEFVVGLGNEYLGDMCDPRKALAWVKSNVQCYLPATKIAYIAVGNEVLTFNDSALSSRLLPAMENVHAALVALNLHRGVAVTTAHNLGVLGVSYPPSAAATSRRSSPASSTSTAKPAPPSSSTPTPTSPTRPTRSRSPSTSCSSRAPASSTPPPASTTATCSTPRSTPSTPPWPSSDSRTCACRSPRPAGPRKGTPTRPGRRRRMRGSIMGTCSSSSARLKARR